MRLSATLAKKKIIVYILVALFIVGLLGYGLYLRSLESKLEPVFSQPSIALEPQWYRARTGSGDQEVIDIGYGQLIAPMGLLETQGVYEDIAISMRSTDSGDQIVFLVPFEDNFQELLDYHSPAIQSSVGSQWELEYLAIQAEPFSAFQIPFIGHAEARKRAELLIIKYIALGNALEFWLFKGDQLNARITQYDEWSNVVLYFKNGHWSHGIIIDGKVRDNRAVIDALLTGYRFSEEIKNETDVRHAVEGLTLPPMEPERKAHQPGIDNPAKRPQTSKNP